MIAILGAVNPVPQMVAPNPVRSYASMPDPNIESQIAELQDELRQATNANGFTNQDRQDIRQQIAALKQEASARAAQPVITPAPEPAAPAAVAPGAVPASAAIAALASTPTVAPYSNSVSFMDWLGEETLFAGVPNGAVVAGGAIALVFIFSGKRGRR